MNQIRKFRVADTVKVKFSSKEHGINVRRPYEESAPYATITPSNVGDLDRKRSPKFHEGMVGLIKRVYGFISIPPDHNKRVAYYQVAFDLDKISPKASNREKVYVDVFEDWLERVERSEL